MTVLTGPGTCTVLVTTGPATVRIVVLAPADPRPAPRASPTIPVAALMTRSFLFMFLPPWNTTRFGPIGTTLPRSGCATAGRLPLSRGDGGRDAEGWGDCGRAARRS